MKKLFTTILMLSSVLVFSQEKEAAKGLEVYNKTKCTQFFVVEWVNNCQCDFSLGKSGTSNIIEIDPDGFIEDIFSNENGNVPMGMFITAVKVGGHHYCEGSSPIGQFCSQHPLTYSYNALYKKECTICNETLATWIPGDCGNPAILVFTEP